MALSNRNGYIIGRAMRNYIFASMLTMAANQLALTLNGIVVGNFIGPQALAAINLIMPVNLALTTLATFLGTGASILASKAIGRRDFEDAGHILSTALLCIIAAGAAIAVAAFMNLDGIASFVCPEDNILPHVKSYLSVFLTFSFVPMFYILFENMVSIDGKPGLVTKATIVYAVVNVVLDLILVGWCGFGLEATAISTVLGQVCAIVISSTHIFSRRCSYRLNLLHSRFSSFISGNLKNGASLMISNLIMVLLFWGINSIVASNLGEDGLFAISVCINLLSIGLMLASGIGQSLFVIGGLFIGQEDFNGLRILSHKVFKAVIITLSVFFLVSELIPGVLATVFGAEDESLVSFTSRGLRIFAISLLPFCLSIVFANLYQVLGRLTLVPLVVVSFPIFLIPSMFLIGGENLWYAFPLASFLVMAIIAAISSIVRRKDRDVTPVTLLPPVKTESVTDFSIKADEKDSIARFVEDESLLRDIMNVLSTLEKSDGQTDIIVSQKPDRSAVTIWTESACSDKDVIQKRMFGMNMISFEKNSIQL